MHKKSSERRSVNKATKQYLHKKVHIKKVLFPSFFYITVLQKKLVHTIKKVTCQIYLFSKLIHKKSLLSNVFFFDSNTHFFHLVNPCKRSPSFCQSHTLIHTFLILSTLPILTRIHTFIDLSNTCFSCPYT